MAKHSDIAGPNGLPGMDSNTFKLICALLLCIAIVFAGAAGFALIEGWSIGDGLYMTVITISTVGYGETNTLSPAGRVFTSVLIVLSIVAMTLTTAYFTSLIVSNEISGKFWRNRMIKSAARLKNHTIICGGGQMTQVIIDSLARSQQPVVVIEEDEAEIKDIKRRFPEVVIIEGSPKCELSLADANLLTAKVVVAALPDEFDNLLISMTCKELGNGIQVIARTNDTKLQGRLSKAGIDHLVCPSQLSGSYVADLILNRESEKELVAI